MVQVGDTFYANVADGREEFTVTEVTGKYVTAEAMSIDWGHLEQAFLVSDVERKQAYQRGVDRMFKEHADFWANQELGATLHYHNGFGEIVRGTVATLEDGRKGLQPTAIVGEWEYHWEFYWSKIKRGDGAWQPSETCVFESPKFAGVHPRWNITDPSGLEPLDFSDREEGNSYLAYAMRGAR